MKRREFIAGLAGAALWPCKATAQGSKKRPVVGILGQGTPVQRKNLQWVQSFFAGMKELGQIEGRDFDVVVKIAESTEDLPSAAKGLVQLEPDVILGGASAMGLAAKIATTKIPIVVAALGNPVALGLVETESRPGGNLTGIMPYVKGLPAKQLELAREIVPGAIKIGIVNNSVDVKARGQWDEIELVASTLGIKIVSADVRKSEEIDLAFKTFEADQVGVVVVLQSNFLVLDRVRIATNAAATRLPTVYGYREHVETGGLISYGINLNSAFNRAATYVHKILKGSSTTDLPVEFPTKLELVINLKTAKALGLEVPPTLLARADEVIE